jgi:hypothetical protein
MIPLPKPSLATQNPIDAMCISALDHLHDFRNAYMAIRVCKRARTKGTWSGHHDHPIETELLAVSDEACVDHDFAHMFRYNPALKRGECHEEGFIVRLVVSELATEFVFSTMCGRQAPPEAGLGGERKSPMAAALGSFAKRVLPLFQIVEKAGLRSLANGFERRGLVRLIAYQLASHDSNICAGDGV